MVLQDLNSPDCDMDFLPGFGPTCESSGVSLSPSLLGGTGEIDGRAEPSATLFSGPLAGAQMALANELYVATNCLCYGLESSIAEVSWYTNNEEFIFTDIPKFTHFFLLFIAGTNSYPYSRS
jgi:hypothetical protein